MHNVLKVKKLPKSSLTNTQSNGDHLNSHNSEFLGIHSSVQGLIKNLPSNNTRQPTHKPWNSVFTIKRTENYAKA